MCGFAGFVRFNGPVLPEEQRAEILEKMGAVLSRRGPDEQTSYDDGYLSFVFRRLSIVDVEHGTQPIWNEDESLFISVNGEIYNHARFREELKEGHRFRTHSDSEAVLHLFEEFGTSCFEKLNGMFSTVLYDTSSRTLTLARDRLGIKPLYWVQTENGFIFASELKALLMHPECPREIDWHDLDLDTLQHKSPVSTYIRNVRHLDGGCWLSVSPEGEISKQRYWSLEDHLRHENETFDAQEAIRRYEELIVDSTTKRLMSDVPVGLYLSGGIDSSLLAAIAARKEKNLHCFTVAEKTTVATGDAPQAVKVTEQLGVPLYAAHFDVDEYARDFTLRDFERTIAMIESPRFNPEWLFKRELHRFAKEQVPEMKVVLLGQGADEFAGGYSNRDGAGFKDWGDYMAREVSPEVRSNFGRETGIPDDLKNVINLNHFDNELDDRAADYHEKMRLLISQLQHFNLWHEDRSSSYYGLEARVPYLDHRLVEFLAEFPDLSQEPLFWDKSIVRQVLAKTLEDYPPDRPKVPFIATEDYSSIDRMMMVMIGNLYPAFRMLYLEVDDNPLFLAARLDELFQTVQADIEESVETAWWLMTLMAVAVFEKFCRNPDAFLTFLDEDEGPVCRRLSADELGRLDELYPPDAPADTPWTLASIVRIPERVRLLSGLDARENGTELYLHRNQQVVRTLTIPHTDGWVVDLLGRMANHDGEPGDLQYWSGEMNVSPQALASAFEFLVTKGFVEKTG